MNLDGTKVPISQVSLREDRVLLKSLERSEMAERTASGLFLPQQAEDHQQLLQGEVVAIGPKVRDILPGMRVLCKRFAKTAIDRDGKYWITYEANVECAFIEEESDNGTGGGTP